MSDSEKHNKVTLSEAAKVYSKPKVIGMVFLGFSAGLPFLLVFTTLTAWLRDAGVDRSTIGFFTWVGITYSIKVLWAPVVDRLPLPWITAIMGKRRSWMLLAQLTIALGLAGMALQNPGSSLELIAFFALLTAFGSATQDITIDAYRIEAMEKQYQGAMAASYIFGYRAATLVAGAGTLYIAEAATWTFAYLVMAALMGIGMVTTLIITEPQHVMNNETQVLEERLEKKLAVDQVEGLLPRLSRWFIDAVIGPFVEFFHRNGWYAIWILLLISCFRISDISLAAMANPFYLDKGFSLTDIANVTKIFGIIMTLIGATLGGILVIKYSTLKLMLVGAILVAITNVLFAVLAVSDANLLSLTILICLDNLSGGFATSIFIAYLSGMTNTTYTATQYALFSSLMTLPGKFIGGFSGMVVDSAGYPIFFIYSGLLGIPAIFVILFLIHSEQRIDAAPPSSANKVDS